MSICESCTKDSCEGCVYRSSTPETYHGRTGYPLIHIDGSGKKYTMVRSKGGGTKRLYLKDDHIPKKYSKPVKHRRFLHRDESESTEKTSKESEEARLRRMYREANV